MSLASKAVLLGQETPDQFFARTRQDWVRLARYLMARCHVPEGVEEADVVQEMQIAAWRYIAKYDQKRGSNPDSFIMFNAIVRAKRWLKQQARRGGVGGRPELESRDEERELPRAEPACPPAQEDELSCEDELRRLLDAVALRRTRICLVAAWRYGDLEAAGSAIYDDQELRRLYRLDCRGDARRVVVKELTRAITETTT